MSYPKQIMIVGGGTAGWITANLFAKRWPKDKALITLIEAPDIETIGVGEGSTPSLKRFFEVMGVSERDWMTRCNATYKANIRFTNWNPEAPSSSYSHPFRTQIDLHTEQAFFKNCQNRRLGYDVPTLPDQFLLNSVLATQKKVPVAPSNFPFQMEYGYHFDAALLGAFLRDLALSHGVSHLRARVKGVERNSGGEVLAVVVDEGRTLSADFFVDCSGFASLIMERALGVPFKTFKSNLFNDSAVVIATTVDDEPPVETQAISMTNGWRWSIPLASRCGNGYVFSSDFTSPDAAEAELRASLGQLGEQIEARHLKFKVGQLSRHWEKNCIAVGLSQGFIEPLEATAIHLVLNTVEKFIHFYESGNFTDMYRSSFNSSIDILSERIRDYIVAHYKLNGRADSQYWVENRENMNLSSSLRHILDVWYRCGDLSTELETQKNLSHFANLSWHCLLAGYHVFPPISQMARDDVNFYEDLDVSRFLGGCSQNFQKQNTALCA